MRETLPLSPMKPGTILQRAKPQGWLPVNIEVEVKDVGV